MFAPIWLIFYNLKSISYTKAPVAQWIERPPPKGQVAGSIPARGTNSSCTDARCFVAPVSPPDFPQSSLQDSFRKLR